jgi:para-aminobenzoate synthetase component I
MLSSHPSIVVIELPPEITPEVAFRSLKELPYCCWLDSALLGGARGRYSFLCADPIDRFEIHRPVADPLSEPQSWLDRYRLETIPGLPPFQGGIVGYLGYELGRCYEKVPAAKHDEFSTPLVSLGLYDVVLSWDHEAKQGWLISRGLRLDNPDPDQELAEERATKFLDCIRNTQVADDKGANSSGMAMAHGVHAMAHGLTAEQFETRLGGGWLGNCDSPGFRERVQQARDYIYAGDIFQVNLSHRLLCPARCGSAELYERLRTVNATPFACYFDFGTGQIISSSPERFFVVDDRWIETRPIKGTRRRTGDPAEDALLAEELKTSEKDRSENIMIVDLLRNDLSKVCEIDSMKIDQFCEIEAYPFVLHLVSSIRARLRREVQWSDVIKAVFPGGSITGAPKVRAMEIIAELEPTVRGPYCGSMGYVGFDGRMDWNILIRTLTASRGWWQFQVGGGIVADSDPSLEEEETWTKAAGLVAAIRS